MNDRIWNYFQLPIDCQCDELGLLNNLVIVVEREYAELIMVGFLHSVCFLFRRLVAPEHVFFATLPDLVWEYPAISAYLNTSRNPRPNLFEFASLLIFLLGILPSG